MKVFLIHTHSNFPAIDEELCCPVCEDFCSCGGGAGDGDVGGNSGTSSTNTTTHQTIPSTIPKSKSSSNKKRHTTLSTSLKATSTKKKTFKSLNEDDIADQLALSEFYFNQSSSSSTDDDCDHDHDGDDSTDEKYIIDYYGYSSSTDVAIDSLFLHSESECGSTDFLSPLNDDAIGGADDDGDDDSGGIINNNSSSSDSSDNYLLEEMLINNDIAIPLQDVGNNELNLLFPNSISQTTSNPESLELKEQLSKITPQILAAISIATKKIQQQQQLQQQQQQLLQHHHHNQMSSSSVKIGAPYHQPGNGFANNPMTNNNNQNDLLDLKKGESLFSSSPTKSSLAVPKRLIPIDAFRKMRSNFKMYYATPNATEDGRSFLKTALRHKNMANCTLVAQKEEKTTFPENLFVSKRRNSVVDFGSALELKDSIWEIEIDDGGAFGFSGGLVELDDCGDDDCDDGTDADSDTTVDSGDSSSDDDSTTNNHSSNNNNEEEEGEMFVLLNSDSEDDSSIYDSINQKAILNDIHSLLLKK